MDENTANMYPLFPMGERVRRHAPAGPGSPACCRQLSHGVEGGIDPDLFEKSFRELVKRHEILRTVFKHEGGQSPPRVVPKERTAVMERIGITHLDGEAQARFLKRYREADLEKPFDPGRDLPIRLALIQLSGDRYEVIWSHSHVLVDGWSMGILRKEFMILYEAFLAGKKPGLSPPPPLADYIKGLGKLDRESAAAFWENCLSGYETRAEIPAASSLGEAPGGQAAAELLFEMDGERTRGLGELAEKMGVALNTVLQCLWGVLLSRYCRNSDVVFGSVVPGRSVHIPRIGEMVGSFVNTVPVRIRALPEKPFSKLLAEVGAAAKEAEAHHHYPLSEIQGLTALGKALLHCRYSLGDFPPDEAPARCAGFRVTGGRVREETHDGFHIRFTPGETLSVQLSFHTGRHDRRLVTGIFAHLVNLATAFLETPDLPVGEAPLLSTEESDRLIREGGRGIPPLESPDTLVDRFQFRAAETPDAVALSCRGRTLTYEELNLRAGRLAAMLREKGAGPESRVGLCLSRNERAVVGMLGILMAGAAYVPLDHRYPPERRRFMIEDADLSIIVTEEKHERGFRELGKEILRVDAPAETIGRAPEPSPHTGLCPDNTAYVIYTSGSTGTPKGVAVTHENVVRLFDATDHRYGFGPGDVWTLFHSLSFDFSVWEVWGALLYGGRLVVVPHWIGRAPDLFRRLLKEEGVTVLNQTPSAFKRLMGEEAGAGDRLSALETVILGGEALDIPSLSPWFGRYGDETPALVNMYGITETTVHATWRRIWKKDLQRRAPVIGTPIPDLAVHILDEQGRPVPEGVPGEILVAGAGVARGYLNRPGLTAERFIRDPFTGKPAYRTGDLALRDFDGETVYLGRIDDQVKIRGFRIEPGEIEGVLRSLPPVRDAAVVQVGEGEEKRLVAHVVPAGRVTASELRSRLGEILPSHMVPATFSFTGALPLTVNGKLDRRLLSEMVPAEGASSFAPPESDGEKLLAGIWAEVLKVPRVGLDCNYFALGGNSVRAIRVVSRLLAKGVSAEIRDMFQYPTVRALAPRLKVARERKEEVPGKGHVPLTPGQKRFFSLSPLFPHRFNQAVLLGREGGFDPGRVTAALNRMAARHDVFRAWFIKGETGWEQHLGEGMPMIELAAFDFRGQETPLFMMERAARELREGFDPGRPPLFRAALFRLPEGERLLLLMHRLIVDGISWRILLEEFTLTYGEPPGVGAPPPATDGYAAWARAVSRHVREGGMDAEIPYWRERLGAFTARLPGRPGANTRERSREVSVDLPVRESGLLLREANGAYNTTTEELLLCALARTLKARYDWDDALVAVEGHGRESLVSGLDVGNAAGWFAGIYPVLLPALRRRDLGHQIKSVRECLRSVPLKGFGYTALRYLAPERMPAEVEPEILVNYLGVVDGAVSGGPFSLRGEPVGEAASPREKRAFALGLLAIARGGRITVTLTADARRFSRDHVNAFLDSLVEELGRIAAFCSARKKTEPAPLDLVYPVSDLDEADDIVS